MRRSYHSSRPRGRRTKEAPCSLPPPSRPSGFCGFAILRDECHPKLPAPRSCSVGTANTTGKSAVFRWKGSLLFGASPAAELNHSAGAPDGEIIDAQGGLAYPHWHALPFLAARADAFIQLQIVADHRDAREDIGAVADQRGAFERCAEFAVLDGVCLACG